jgi:hypothetical protein
LFAGVWLTPSGLSLFWRVFLCVNLFLNFDFQYDLVSLYPFHAKFASVLTLLDDGSSELNLDLKLVRTEIMIIYLSCKVRSTFPNITFQNQDLGKVNVSSSKNTFILHKFTELTFWSWPAALKSLTVQRHATLPATKKEQICLVYVVRFIAFAQAQLYGLEIIPLFNSFLSRVEGFRNLFVRRFCKVHSSVLF